MRCLMNEMMLDTKERKLLEPSTGWWWCSGTFDRVVVVFWNLRQGGGGVLEPSTGWWWCSGTFDRVVVVFWNLRQGGGCRDSYKMGLSDTPPNIIII